MSLQIKTPYLYSSIGVLLSVIIFALGRDTLALDVLLHLCHKALKKLLVSIDGLAFDDKMRPRFHTFQPV